MLDPLQIEPERYYWAMGKIADPMVEVVYISTVFGKEREYWTVARFGNDTHAMVEEFDFLKGVSPPTENA